MQCLTVMNIKLQDVIIKTDNVKFREDYLPNSYRGAIPEGYEGDFYR